MKLEVLLGRKNRICVESGVFTSSSFKREVSLILDILNFVYTRQRSFSFFPPDPFGRSDGSDNNLSICIRWKYHFIEDKDFISPMRWNGQAIAH